MTDDGGELSSASRSAVVFLHGLLATPQSWQQQVEALPAETLTIAPWLRGMRPGHADPFELGAAAATVVGELDRVGAGRGRLCGLSLGGTVALQAAVDFPERVARLVVCAATVNPPRWALRAQRMIIRAMPAKRLADQGIAKDQAITTIGQLMQVDLTSQLKRIKAPTLVLVGALDKPNKAAGRLIAAAIPGAEFAEIPGAGHLANVDAPEAFNERAINFLLAD